MVLQACVVHAAVVCGTGALDFGEVHPQAPKQLELVLTNPTKVDAVWAVVDASAPTAAAGTALSGAAAALGSAAAARQEAAGATGHLAPTGAMLNGALLSNMLLSDAVSSCGSRSGTSTSAILAGSASGTVHAANGGIGVDGSRIPAQFGPFTLTPASGVIPGRGLGMPRSQRVVVTFSPPDDTAAAASLRVTVLGGHGCDLLLSGRGAYDETREHQACLKQL
jgi:hypothetical protein